MADRKIDEAAMEKGMGLAAYLIVGTLLDKLADNDILTRDQLNDILSHALANAKANQATSPIAGAHAAAAKAIGALLAASEAKAGRKRTPQ